MKKILFTTITMATVLSCSKTLKPDMDTSIQAYSKVTSLL